MNAICRKSNMTIDRSLKVLLVLFALLVCPVAMQAQDKKSDAKFSPTQFDAELQQYIVQEAGLTPSEAASFFPVYREMQKKQRALYMRQRQMGHIKPSSDKGCEQAIRQRDEIDLELKRIQQAYHDRLLSVVSASKLYDAIKAEDRFHRLKLKNMRGGVKK